MSEIDVSKCVHYHDGGCGNDNTMFECCSKNNCIYKQLQQLKLENEELKEQYKLAEPLFQACKIKDLKIKKYKTTLNEIEDIIEECKTNGGCYDTCKYYDLCNCDTDSFVLKLIKQAKEGEGE